MPAFSGFSFHAKGGAMAWGFGGGLGRLFTTPLEVGKEFGFCVRSESEDLGPLLSLGPDMPPQSQLAQGTYVEIR